MKSIATIENALYAWAAAVLGTGVPVIWYHLNAPRPTVPYVALHLFSQRSVGVDAQLPPDNTGKIEVVGNRDFTLQCQGIGASSHDFMEKLKTSLEKPTVQDSLRAAGVAVVDRLPILDISELVDSRWEERQVMDLIFRYAQTETDTPGLISHVNMEEKYLDPQLNTITVLNVSI